MRLTGAGLFVVDVGEPLTPILFDTLIARGRPFAVKADYRRLPPPIEELDLVHLRPDRDDACGPGTLVLRANDDGAFEFTRTAHGGARTVRVIAVERPGARVRLDTRRWRVLGRMLAASPVVARAFTAIRALALRTWAPIPRVAFPLMLPPAEALVAGVRAKWGAGPEVRRLVAESSAGLEAWEKDVFDRLVKPGGRVLVVGCGAGRVALALAAAFRVTGIDFVPALVDEARRLAAAGGVAATFEVATVEGLAAHAPATFDAVLVAAPVYEQTPGRQRRVAFLRALAGLCAPDGLIVLCAGWHRDRGPRRALIDGARWLLRRLGVRNVAEPGDRFLYHLSMISDHTTSCFLHGFQRPAEIAAEIRRAGLVAERHPEGAWLLRIRAR